MVCFVAPSPAALALNIAYSAAEEAERLKKAFQFVPSPSADGIVNQIESTKVLFDYFERAMVTVFFAYQSIEAFCNDQLFKISADHVEIKRNREVEKYERREAERKLQTSEKLGDVLPKILHITSPKDKPQWQRFRDLERVRNEVVHMKNQTVRNIDRAKDSQQVLLRLLSEDCRLWIRIALESIGYFIREPIPTWFTKAKQRDV